MEAVIFIVVVLLGCYLRDVSRRVAKLEAVVRSQGIAAEQKAVQAAVPSPLSSVLPGMEPIAAPSETAGLNRPVSSIAPVQWVGGIGVLALLFGIGFFFKFAIDQGWVTETARLLLGALVGGLLLLLGELWRQKYAAYSQVLVGGGLGLWYFTIFAGFQFYHKLDQPIAFALAIVTTIIAMVLAYRYSAKALGILAAVGAYLSPLLVGSGENQQVGLFVYLSIVNLGLVLMLMRAFWPGLLFVGLLGTGADFAAWAWHFASTANAPASVAFLVINYFLVALLSAMIYRKVHELSRLTKDADLHFGAFYTIFGIAVFGTVIGLLYGHYHSYLAPVMLLLGVITFMAYAFLDRLNFHRLNFPMSLVGSKFLVAAIVWQFRGRTEDVYLLLAASLGLAVGFAVQRWDLRVWGVLLLVFAVFKSLFVDIMGTHTAFLNSAFAVNALAVVLVLVAAAGYEKYLVQPSEKQMFKFFRAFAAGVVWFAVSREVLALRPELDSANGRNLLLSLWWMAYAVLLSLVGGLRGYLVLRYVAIVLFGLVVLKVFLYDVQALDLGYRIVSFLILGLVLLSVVFAYQKNKDKMQRFLSEETKD